MKSVSIHDAKTNLSKYIAAAKRGETIYIGSFGKPEVAIIKIDKPRNKRELGIAKGKGWIASDFDEPDAQWQEVIDIMNYGPVFTNEKNPSRQ